MSYVTKIRMFILDATGFVKVLNGLDKDAAIYFDRKCRLFNFPFIVYSMNINPPQRLDELDYYGSKVDEAVEQGRIKYDEEVVF